MKITRASRRGWPPTAACASRCEGGSSGFEYAIDFEKEPRETDLVLEYDGLKVYVDPISSRFLAGTTIDYSLGMTGTGFKFHNPKATGTCGCGSSFSV